MAEKFCWVELLTSDVEAAQAFYGEVVGWTSRRPALRTAITAFLSMARRRRPDAAAGGGQGERRAAGMVRLYRLARTWTPSRAISPRAASSIARPKPSQDRAFRGGRRPAGRALRAVDRSQRPPASCRRCPWAMSAGTSFSPTMSSGLRLLLGEIRLDQGPGAGYGAVGPLSAFSTGGQQVGGIMQAPEIPQVVLELLFDRAGARRGARQGRKGGRKIVHDRWRFPAAPGSRNVSTRRALSSRWSPRGAERARRLVRESCQGFRHFRRE